MTENYILNKEQEIFSKLKLLEKDLTYFIESEIQGELGESLYELLKNENFDIEDEEQSNGYHALVGLLMEGQEKGILKVDDPIAQAQIIHSMVHGLASLYIDGHIHIKDNFDGLYETCFKTLTEGLILNKIH